MSVVQFPGKSARIPTTTQYSGDGGGGGMEARLAKLEADVGHIKIDCSDVKSDIRIANNKIDDIKDSIWSAKVWALGLYIALAGGMLFVMAKGFKWL
jgi:hypothetical protein